MSSGITLTHLQYFVAAAETGSMTGAAERLHIAQSAVSTAVSTLERKLKLQLFLRQRSRGLVLTASGAVLLDEAQSLLRQFDTSIDRVTESAHGTAGVIKFSCMNTVSPFVVPALVDVLADRHPQLSLEVHEVSSWGAVEDLKSGHCDVALTYDFGQLQGMTIVSTIRSNPPIILLPPGHRLAVDPVVDPADLAAEPMVLLDLPLSDEYFLSVMRAHGVDPRVAHRSSNYETVRSLVAHGHGYTVLNQQPAHPLTYDGGRLVSRRMRPPARALDLVVVSAVEGATTARVSLLVDVLKELYRRPPNRPPAPARDHDLSEEYQ